MIKVALFDDHSERRDALSLLLGIQQDMQCVGAFENCAHLTSDLKNNIPDVVLMDIDMPEVNGIEGLKQLRKHFPQTLVIMQTVFEDDEKIFASILAGANGYILKKTAPDKLIAAIHEVIDGGAPMTASIARRTLDLFRNMPATTDAGHNLSPREHEILSLMVKGYSHKMVSGELGISVYTVNNHIKKIYGKLEVHNASEVVSVALKRGIVR